MYVSDRWCECYLQLSTVSVSVPGEEELVEAGHRCGEAPSTSSQATISGRQAMTISSGGYVHVPYVGMCASSATLAVEYLKEQ